jgi:hypothetical protein
MLMEKNREIFWGWYIVMGAFFPWASITVPLLFRRFSQTNGGRICLVPVGNIARGNN